jgi:predicted RNA-binding protein with PUA-like domain
MSGWLFKTEPSTYSFDQLEKEKRATWDGVSNNLALKYLRQTKKGDLVLIYHTGDEKRVVGIAEIVSPPYADPKLNDPKMTVVDIKPKHKLQKPISLAEVKANKLLQDFLLVKMSRLSVMPVSADQWKLLVGD